MTDLVPHVPPPKYGEPVRRARLRYLDFNAHDQQLLQELEPVVAPLLHEIVEEFYQHLLGNDATRRVFIDEAMVARLKESQKTYLLQTLRGPYDQDYFQRRWRIGYIHNVIKLDPHWFIGAFQLYHRLLYPRIMAHYAHDPDIGLEGNPPEK